MDLTQLLIHLPNRTEHSIKLKLNELFIPEHIEIYKEEIILEYTSGVSIKKIATKYKFGQRFLGEMLVAWGIKLRTRKNAQYKNITGKNNKGWTGYGEISGRMFHDIRRDAERREIDFRVTIEEIWRLFELQKGKCILSGEDIVIHVKRNLCTASLDRKDCQVGYILDNLQWVHKKVNVMKNRFLDEEYINWCRIVANYNKIEETGTEPVDDFHHPATSG